MKDATCKEHMVQLRERLEAEGFERAARSPKLRSVLEAHRQPDETLGQTLRRLLGATMREARSGGAV